jgi:protein-disulfide isomerase
LPPLQPDARRIDGERCEGHRALIAQSGRIDAAKIRAAADAAGVDWARLQRDQAQRKGEIDALLNRTNGHARTLGLSGTPGMLVGRYLVPGLVDLPTLKRAVAQARERR